MTDDNSSAATDTMAETASAETPTATRKYELMLVIKPTLLESAVEKKLKDFDSFLEGEGAEILLKDNWGKKKLAYPIKGATEGVYIAYNVNLPTHAVREIDEHLRIDNDVMRHLAVSLAEDYVYSKYEEAPPAPKKERREPTAVKKDTPTQYKSGKQAKAGDEDKEKGKSAPVDEKLDEKLDKILSEDNLDF